MEQLYELLEEQQEIQKVLENEEFIPITELAKKVCVALGIQKGISQAATFRAKQYEDALLKETNNKSKLIDLIGEISKLYSQT